jgi:hypothetical protein
MSNIVDGLLIYLRPYFVWACVLLRRASALLFAHEGPDGDPLVSPPALITDVVFIGARHLYLMDFSSENLPDLKSTIERSYPDVKVGCEMELQFHQLTRPYRLQRFELMLRMMPR